MRLRACLLAIAVLVPVRAFAQTPPPAAPPPPPAEAAPPPAAPAPTVVVTPAPAAVVVTPPPAVPAAPPAPAAPMPKLTWGGLVDTYWMYLFNPASGSNSLVPPVGRVFDNNSNSMNLALSKLSLNASIDPVSFQFDLGYGGDAAVINTGAPGPDQFIIEQAFGEIALPGNLTLDFGKFTTTAGAEVIEANKNWLYSRSFLFGIIPFVHTGVRANLKINDMATVQASLVNNWGGVGDPDNNAWKTFGASISLTLNPMVSLIGTTYIGKEATQAPGVGGVPGDTTILVDLVGAFTINSVFGLNANFDYVKAPPTGPTPADNSVADDHQVGISIMGRYVISDRLNFAARGEFLQNHFAGVSTNVGEGTVMAGIDVGKNFELRPEIRGDFSGDQVFAGGTKKNQFTGTLAALTWF